MLNYQDLIEKLPQIKQFLVKNELKKLKTIDSSYFRGKSHFEEDGTQNYLVFQPMFKYFKIIAGVANGSHIYYWNLKDCLTKELILLKCFIMVLFHTQIIMVLKVKSNGIRLKQDKITLLMEKQ